MNALIYPVGTEGGEAVASVLAGRPEIDGVYRVGEIAKGRRLAALCRPGLLILDATSGDDAVEFARDVRTCNPLAQVLVLHDDTVSREIALLLELPFVYGFSAPWNGEKIVSALDDLFAHDPISIVPHYSARLDRISLLDLLQVKTFAGDSTVLSIIGGRGENGQVYLERGTLVHARANRIEGLDALHEILSWPGGNIQEVPLPEEHPTSITLDTGTLLMALSRSVMDGRISPVSREDKENAENGVRHHLGERTVHLGLAAEDQLDQLATLPKILIVDDNLMILRYADNVLARHWTDHALISVQTAEEAEACMWEYLPRIVLLDHHLPDGSGADMAERWGQSPELRHIPIVMISGYHEHLVESARRCPNIVATLTKPFTPGQLIEAVRGAEAFIQTVAAPR